MHCLQPPLALPQHCWMAAPPLTLALKYQSIYSQIRHAIYPHKAIWPISYVRPIWCSEMRLQCRIDIHLRRSSRTLKDIRNDPRLFGGVVFCFCGDFRQILPIVPRGTRGQIVSACIKRSPLWRHVQRLTLTINMRLLSEQMSPEERLRQEEFANLILAIGEGRDINNDMIQWPLDGILPENTSRSLANAIYPILTDPNPFQLLNTWRNVRFWRQEMIQSTISMNNCSTSMTGELFTSYSADALVDEGDAETYATEYLNTINLPTLPPHELKLKIGAPVILLRNLNQSTGLCNGTRLRVARISQRVVECEILSGKYAGNMIMIPRIPFAIFHCRTTF